MEKMKSIIVTVNKETFEFELFADLKEFCEKNGLSYDTYARKKGKFEVNGIIAQRIEVPKSATKGNRTLKNFKL